MPYYILLSRGLDSFWKQIGKSCNVVVIPKRFTKAENNAEMKWKRADELIIYVKMAIWSLILSKKGKEYKGRTLLPDKPVFKFNLIAFIA